MLLRRACARDGKIVESVEERAMAFGEVRDLGGPIVHFRIDVRCVFTVPGWLEGLVPEPLQVGGLPTFAARCDQQIAAVLKKKRYQLRISCGGERFDPLVGG
jgi:hypothetical protein